MSYVKNKPDQSPSPKLDAPTIKGNFAAFGTTFSTLSGGIKYNHTNLNDAFQGDHESVIFEKQASDPSVSDDLVALYAKDAASMAGTQPQLFIRLLKFLPNANDTKDADNTPMQLTYNSVNTAGPQYQSFLPGGYLLYTGSTTNIATNITLVPAPTSIVCVIATPHTMTTLGTPIPFSVAVQIISNDTFKINSTLNSPGPVIGYSFTWMAIAKV